MYYIVESYIENPSNNEEVGQIIINKLKNHKVPGTDGITAELLKNGDSELWKRIHNLVVFNNMVTGTNAKRYQNYRPIILLNVVYKILSGIISGQTEPQRTTYLY